MCDGLAVGAVGDLGRLPGGGDRGRGRGATFSSTKKGTQYSFFLSAQTCPRAPGGGSGTCMGVVSLGGSLLGNCEQSWLPRNVSLEGEPSIIANKLPSK